MKKNISIAGLKERKADERDFQLGALIKWPKLEELPEEFSVEPLSIKDQISDGNDDFCASCAAAGMIEPREEVELYYPYLFAAAKYAAGDDPDSFGLQLRDVGRALQKYGIPEVADVPESVKSMPHHKRRRFENYPQELREKALKHKAASYFFVENSPYDPYDTARAAQWYFREKKQNIMIGVMWGWDTRDFVLDGFPEGFGHALWKCGWYKDGLKLVNSAGEEAGVDGFHKITRETFNKYARKYGMLMIVDMPKGDAEYYLQNQIQIGDNWLVQLWKVIKNWLT